MKLFDVLAIARQRLLVFYITAVVIVFLLPNPEFLIIRAVERAGLVLIVVRGLKGHYDDFTETLEGRKRRR